MDGVPFWQMMLGLTGMAVWGALCGLPALAIYSMAARARSGYGPWVLLVLLLLIWFPLVTALCVWAVSLVIGL